MDKVDGIKEDEMSRVRQAMARFEYSGSDSNLIFQPPFYFLLFTTV